MLPVDVARARVIECVAGPDLAAPHAIETVDLDDAPGRVLARDLAADSDLPPFTRSTVDGFAVRAADAAAPGARLRIAGESAAGHPSAVAIGKGEALRIFTGAALPDGADAVVMVEKTEERDGSVALHEPARLGQNLSRKGEDLARGATALARGTAISAAHVTLLASIGAVRLEVLRRPRVRILATGSELVPPHETPPFGSIRESNGPALRALARNAGAEVLSLERVRDDHPSIEAAALRGLDSDVFLISGGSSVGDYDFTPEVLLALGVDVHFDRVDLKPGKPTLFGTRGRCAVFGLPGNPISAFVTFHLFVRPALMRRAGLSDGGVCDLEATLAERVARNAHRDQVLPAAAFLAGGRSGKLMARFTGWNGSGDVTCLTRANALLHVPKGEGAIEAGSAVRVLPIDGGRVGDVAFSPR